MRLQSWFASTALPLLAIVMVSGLLRLDRYELAVPWFPPLLLPWLLYVTAYAFCHLLGIGMASGRRKGQAAIDAVAGAAIMLIVGGILTLAGGFLAFFYAVVMYGTYHSMLEIIVPPAAACGLLYGLALHVVHHAVYSNAAAPRFTWCCIHMIGAALAGPIALSVTGPFAIASTTAGALLYALISWSAALPHFYLAYRQLQRDMTEGILPGSNVGLRLVWFVGGLCAAGTAISLAADL